ncbi:MAG: Gfo/Idh/MocA family protein [Elusimicrobiota bacterium]
MRRNVLVVGSGWVSAQRHVPALLANGCRIAGVVNNSLTGEHLARKLGAAWYKDLEHAPADFDLVSIGTPPDTHWPLLKQAAAFGKPILCEKPLVTSRAELEETRTVFGRPGAPLLGVYHNFQFTRSCRAVVERMGNEPLVRVLAVQFSNPRRRLPTWYQRLRGGLFFDESPHFFYLLRKFLGNYEIVSRQAELFQNDEVRALNLAVRGEQNVSGHVLMLFDAPVSEWYFLVFQQSRLHIMDLFRDVVVTLPNDDWHAPLNILRTSTSFLAQHLRGVFGSGLRHLSRRLDYGNGLLVEKFLAAAETGDRSGLAGFDLEAGLDVVERILSCLPPPK